MGFAHVVVLSVAAEQPHVNLLFVGNSLTYVNSLPQTLDALTAGSNSVISTASTSSVAGGATFREHAYDPSDSELSDISLQSVRKIREGAWDFVVLQDQSDAYFQLIPPFFNQYGATYNVPSVVCNNAPVSWFDSTGDSCMTYEDQNYCTPAGGYGNSWNVDKTFEDYADSGGINALSACCACGGGRNVTQNSTFLRYSERLVGETEKVGAVPIFFQTWRRKGDINLDGLQNEVDSAYTYTAAFENAMCAPCGNALKRNYELYGDAVYTDDIHPSKVSQYTNACVFYATLTNMTPVGLNDAGTGLAASYNLTVLQLNAWETYLEYRNENKCATGNCVQFMSNVSTYLPQKVEQIYMSSDKGLSTEAIVGIAAGASFAAGLVGYAVFGRNTNQLKPKQTGLIL